MKGKRVGIGKQNHFRSSVFAVAWIDLLGYGSMLRECGFDPTSSQANAAVTRLEMFNEISLKHANLNFPILQINDGIAAWRELSFRTNSVTQDFICRSLEFFYDLSQREKANGFPGPRMVIATGVRMKMKSIKSEISNQRANRLIDKVKQKDITYEQAIHQACSYSQYANGVQELQANFAFTKAFLAEDSGSKHGIAGNNVYIDMSFFGKEDNKIQCIELDVPFMWNACQGLESLFAKVNGFSKEQFSLYSKEEILSTREIASLVLRCNSQEEILKRLKK